MTYWKPLARFFDEIRAGFIEKSPFVMRKMRWPYFDRPFFPRPERIPSAYAVLEISFFVIQRRIHFSPPLLFPVTSVVSQIDGLYNSVFRVQSCFLDVQLRAHLILIQFCAMRRNSHSFLLFSLSKENRDETLICHSRARHWSIEFNLNPAFDPNVFREDRDLLIFWARPLSKRDVNIGISFFDPVFIREVK